jgi:Sulfotransferase domain
MKLIGAGMPRTATLTQKIALEMLGLGPCYHMVDVLADLEQAALWERALDGEGPWEEIFAGYHSTVDWPGGYFYRELIDVYPEAKVLLSVREPQAWEASMRETVWAVRHGESLIRLLSSAQAHVNPQWQGFVHMIDRLLWEGKGTFASGNETPEQLITGMERHNEEVRRSVPPERLLVWSATEGWEPLCEFLELPVPDMAFPHVNDRTEFLNRVIDGSLLALTEWRQQQESVEPSFAIRAAEGV